MLTPQVKYLKDYQPADYAVDFLHLYFDIQDDYTEVTAKMRLIKVNASATRLCLDGEDQSLITVQLNGETLDQSQYQLTPQHLIINQTPDQFDLTIVSRNTPHKNTLLMGLYRSNSYLVTQCEPEGFRRITYFLDRPDVLTFYTTTIEASKKQFPILLSNGNCMAQGDKDGGRHWVTWEDPHKKPSYLFALVVGNLACLEDTFVTRSKRTVKLQIYAEAPDIKQCAYAMTSLKQAMAWDEETYGREYDLDVYMIVAVADFNMGAMENKGLNIFNTKYVLVDQETATDQDFQNVQSVIGHEYFHNWSGNRITCRDWFQLSLKEGLTIFRDQSFSADLNSATVKRINDVRVLRTAQFAEDSGPMAHPVQPASFIEINNFYTVTVYNKGAEVIRMIRTLIGEANFRKGMDLYFQRHDGQAVTIHEFATAMADASGYDLSQFRRWYHQAGTPQLTITDTYDEKKQEYTLTIEQAPGKVKDRNQQQPFHIPIQMALLNHQGVIVAPKQITPQVINKSNSILLELTKQQQTWVFNGLAAKPIPSFLHHFSAPVKWRYEYNDADLAQLMLHDPDPFARWDASQQLMLRTIMTCIEDFQTNKTLTLNSELHQAIKHLLENPCADEALLAEILCLPSERYIAETMEVIDPEAIHQACQFVKRTLAHELRTQWLAMYEARLNASATYEVNAAAIATRRLKNVSLSYLMQSSDPQIHELCYIQYQQATNMTDRLAAFSLLAHTECPERVVVLEDFYERWQSQSLVIDKWFAVQALSPLNETGERVRALIEHPDFCATNPNRVRALLGTFVHQNPYHFHNESGQMYAWIADQIINFDRINPHTATSLVSAFNQWQRFDVKRQSNMQEQLQKILEIPELSKDVYEIVSKSLA